jgi:hypothetical protein
MGEGSTGKNIDGGKHKFLIPTYYAEATVSLAILVILNKKRPEIFLLSLYEKLLGDSHQEGGAVSQRGR